MTMLIRLVGSLALISWLAAGGLVAQTPQPPRGTAGEQPAPAKKPAQPAPAQPAPAPSVPLPPGSQPVGAPVVPGAAEMNAEQYRIGPEDIIDISVWKNADLTRTVAVRPDGKISVPLLNDLQAAGLTPMQLRDQLAKGYATYQPEPEVSVIVKEIHSIKVSVVGMVKTPGRYELKSQATVLEALALAGGFTDFAKLDRIVVFRKSGKDWYRLPFNYRKVIDWSEEENFMLQPGDIVVVP